MTTKNDTSWMPPDGSYPVSVGSSLAGALKANKGLPQAPKLSDRGFYSFRYNFEPESIDPYKPGTIEVKKEGDKKTANIERASTVPGEGQLFSGPENPAKDVDCVLLYDDELGIFTLEKLDSLINATWGGKSAMPSNRPSESPALTAPSAPASPTKKEYDIDLDLKVEPERGSLNVVEDPPPRRPPIKQEPPSLKTSTSSTPNGTPGPSSLPKKPMLKREPKPKLKEPAPIFMNPNSAAARVANKKSAPPKRELKTEPKPEQKSPALPTPISKVAKLAGNLKNKGVKREAEPETKEPARAPKRPKPSPPPLKARSQPKPQTSKPPALAAGLPPKPQVAMVPPPQPKPQPKPQPPAKKGFSLELPTGTSSTSSSMNPLALLAGGGGGGGSLSLPSGPSTPGDVQPPPPTFAETAPPVLSDSESDWDEVDADGPSPPQPPPQSEPQQYILGSLTIEEDPPAGFNGTLDIVDGDEDRYDYDEDADAEGDGEGVDIDMDDLMAEMDQQLQSDGGGGGEGDANDQEIDDFLANEVWPEPEREQEEDQDGDGDGDVGSYPVGDMFGDDDYSSSSEDSDD